MTQPLEITRDAFIDQAYGLLPYLGGGCEGEARAELGGMWSALIGEALETTLYLRSFDEEFGYWRGALTEDGFYAQYLPIDPVLVKAAA